MPIYGYTPSKREYVHVAEKKGKNCLKKTTNLKWISLLSHLMREETFKLYFPVSAELARSALKYHWNLYS